MKNIDIMETSYEFTIGQSVRTRDEDDGTIVNGTVIDKTRDTVIIKWEDLNDPCEHERFEFPKFWLSNNR